jgi:hypothetical protein
MASQMMKDDPKDSFARRITQKGFQTLLRRHSAWSAGQKSRREDVKTPKNHFQSFCIGNRLSSKPFQPESHKTIFRIFRKIFGGTRGRGSLISFPVEHPAQPEGRTSHFIPTIVNLYLS